MTHSVSNLHEAQTVIVGVDTHKHMHVAVAIDSRGIRLGAHSFGADSEGYRALLTWAEAYGGIEAVGIEGTGGYGVGLSRTVHRAGHRVVEVNRVDRRLRRAAGKSDTIDAEAAARAGTSLHLIVDSTGLSIVGEGEWAAAKHGGRGRRGWRKLHLGVDGSRVIVACALTEPTADDAITGISLVDEVDGHLTRVTADPAYDTLAFYGAAGARGARVVVPPTKTASLSRRGARSGARDRTISRVKALGRRRWKKASGSHQHARVENAFFRYTSIVGDCLRARSSSGQRREAVLACNVLNRMTELGRPVSYRIGR